MDSRQIFVTGYARLPQGITASELYTVIAIGLVIRMDSGEILETDCTLATDTARRFVRDLITGKNINNLDEIIDEIRLSYFGHAKKAIVSALKMCHTKYHTALAGDFGMDS